MLLRIDRRGADAVRSYSSELDGWDPPSFEVTPDQIADAGDSLPDSLKQSIEFAQAQIRHFAQLQRATLTDFETETLPGVFLGQRHVPVARVGAYCPAGRVPMLACPFMTVLVAKVAGVATVISCTPPRGEAVHAPTLHAIATSGADRIFALGGVQALAAMAFGLLDGVDPVDMIVGPGNAYVPEAKKQLSGAVRIDGLAGPTEVVIVADRSADARLAAIDLIAQGEHDPLAFSVLVTPDAAMRFAVYRDVLGLPVVPLDDSDGATITGLQAGDSLVELLQAERPDSPIAKFVASRGPGLHHICFATGDLDGTIARCRAANVRLIDDVPRLGADGKRIAFIHHSAPAGVLVELKES